MNIDLTKPYWKYADDVINNRVITGHLIKQACERMIAWSKRDDIFFDTEDVDRKIRFVQKIKHYEGQYAGKPFLLLPYQQWIIANVYGWKYVGEDNLRVINNVFILTVRQTGKSFLGAAFALIGAVCDNEKAPEISFIANSAKQAAILFKHCSNQAESLDPKGKIFKRFRHDIRIPAVKGTISILSADTGKHDGRHDSVFIRDEGHESKSFELWNVLKTGQVSRKNPLAISISTAGFNIGSNYPLYNQWEYCCQILNNTVEDDTWFAAIYQLDENDDWKNEEVWIKACPSLGVTITMKTMRDQIRSAINTPANETSIRTKNLNEWRQSANVWLSYDKILDVMEDVNLEDYVGETAWMGVDLSVVCDLTAFSVCIPPNPDRKINGDKFIFKSWLYIPDQALQDSSNREIYREWIRRGWAIKTSGNVVDYDHILKDQLDVGRKLYLAEVEYDSYNSVQWSIAAEEAGMTLCAFSQTLGNFNKGTKLFEMLIRSKKCIIDNNPAVAWCFENVELVIDRNENVKPFKAGGEKNKKIDAIISQIEALGGYCESSYFQPEMFVI